MYKKIEIKEIRSNIESISEAYNQIEKAIKELKCSVNDKNQVLIEVTIFPEEYRQE